MYIRIPRGNNNIGPTPEYYKHCKIEINYMRSLFGFIESHYNY